MNSQYAVKYLLTLSQILFRIKYYWHFIAKAASINNFRKSSTLVAHFFAKGLLEKHTVMSKYNLKFETEENIAETA